MSSVNPCLVTPPVDCSTPCCAKRHFFVLICVLFVWLIFNYLFAYFYQFWNQNNYNDDDKNNNNNNDNNNNDNKSHQMRAMQTFLIRPSGDRNCTILIESWTYKNYLHVFLIYHDTDLSVQWLTVTDIIEPNRLIIINVHFLISSDSANQTPTPYC